MKWLVALLLAALPATAQVNITTAPCSMTDGSCSSSGTSAPASCTTAGMVPVFLGSPLALGCDAALTYTTATLAAPVHAGTSFVAAAPGTVTITNATNATPIVVTAVAHGLRTNDRISISGITGNTNANGYFRITRLTADTFSLQNYSTGADIAGNGAYGGTPVAVTGIVQAQRVLVGDGSAPAVVFGVNQDLTLTRAAAATLQLGAANAASPVAQTLQAQGATGTDVAGANLTIRAGAGTGNASGSSLLLQTPTPGASGTTAQTQGTRLELNSSFAYFGAIVSPNTSDTYTNGQAAYPWRSLYLSRATLGSKTKTFTNNTKTGFVTIAVPSSTVATGTIIYEIFVADATNTQAISGELKFSAAANSSGTVTAATTADAFTPLNPCTSGTLTNAITQTTGANTLTIEFQPNTSLTSTTREIHYRINSPGVQTITPL